MRGRREQDGLEAFSFFFFRPPVNLPEPRGECDGEAGGLVWTTVLVRVLANCNHRLQRILELKECFYFRMILCPRQQIFRNMSGEFVIRTDFAIYFANPCS